MTRSWIVASVLLLNTTTAHADDRTTAALNWVRLPGAESCIAPQALARAVEARVGRPVLSPLARADWALEGRVERRGGLWVATLSATRGDGVLGSRTVQSSAPDCAALDPQILIVVALLLDSAGALGEVTAPTPSPLPPPSPAPTPCPAEPAFPPSSPPRPVVPTPAVPEVLPRRAQVELGFGVSAGWNPTFAPTVHAALTWSPWGPIVRIRTEADATLPREAAHEEGVASYLSLQGGISLCVAPPQLSRTSLCAGVLAVAHHSEGVGLHNTASQWNLGVTVPLRLRVEVPLSARWGLLASLGGAAHLLWPQWAVADADGRVVRDLGPTLPLSFLADIAASYAW